MRQSVLSLESTSSKQEEWSCLTHTLAAAAGSKKKPSIRPKCASHRSAQEGKSKACERRQRSVHAVVERDKAEKEKEKPIKKQRRAAASHTTLTKRSSLRLLLNVVGQGPLQEAWKGRQEEEKDEVAGYIRGSYGATKGPCTD